MSTTFASIITIGDELLIGQTQDSNSSWMARELNSIGISLKRRVAIGDDRNAILSALGQESAEAQIILLTGGLGPTNDDITKKILCEYFNTQLVLDDQTLRRINEIFQKRGLRILESNLQQAMLPENCTILPNQFGTAPGMWFEKEGKIFISMPGVPDEMKGIMKEVVLPRLKQQFSSGCIIHKTLLTSGLGESFVAERLKEFEHDLPGEIKLAYLPHFNLLKLRLSTQGENQPRLVNLINSQFEVLQSLLGDILIAAEDISLEEILGKLLTLKGATMGAAESCTGGYLSHRITSVPGSSDYFKGTLVCYSDDIKKRILMVEEKTLQRFGAVSEETVRAMAKGALQLLQTDYILAVSGIMGPGGGSVEKPVGTVWMAAGNKDEILSRSFLARYDRQRNIEITAIQALNFLRRFILSQMG
ncbi:MAG: CinA family nicotinamide mononucleotide deamidase-related protein [Chitinophagaceae bacterium]